MVRDAVGDAGELEMERAAILEPRRAAFRAYLAKALLDRGEVARGLRDLAYAAELDPGDATPWLYGALGLNRENRVNESIDYLQRAMALGDHRSLFRSQLLLDEDVAVRGVNLAGATGTLGLAAGRSRNRRVRSNPTTPWDPATSFSPTAINSAAIPTRSACDSRRRG